MLWRIRNATKAGCTFLKDVTDLMDRFTMGDVMSSEEFKIIKYHLDITAGAEGLDDDSSGEEDIEEFDQHTRPLVS